jgi:hypothetical protein
VKVYRNLIYISFSVSDILYKICAIIYSIVSSSSKMQFDAMHSAETEVQTESRLYVFDKINSMCFVVAAVSFLKCFLY